MEIKIQNIKGVQEATKRVNWGVIVGLYLTQILLFQIMKQYTFPVIEAHLNGGLIFDMRKSGYDTATAKELLTNIGERGRHRYLAVQMPLDFLYPCVMATVYYLILVKTSTRFRYSYYVFPILLVVLDWMENVCIILMLSGFELSNSLVKWSSTCTRLKSLVGDYILYFATVAGIIIYISRVLVSKVKRGKGNRDGNRI